MFIFGLRLLGPTVQPTYCNRILCQLLYLRIIKANVDAEAKWWTARCATAPDCFGAVGPRRDLRIHVKADILVGDAYVSP